jgi:hypothetical protein
MRFIHGLRAEALALTLKLLFDPILMKNKITLSLLFSGLLVLFTTTACKKSMDELNVNPNSPTTTNPDYLFTYSVVKGMNSYITNANVHYWLMMNWNMYFANLGGVDAGKEYDSNDGKDAFWTEHYAQALMNAREVQRLTLETIISSTKIALLEFGKSICFHSLLICLATFRIHKRYKGQRV